MKVIQANQALFGHNPYEWHGAAFVVVPFNDLKEIDAEDFEDEDKVLAVLAMVEEAVEQLDAVAVVAGDVLQLLLLLFAAVVLFERIEPLFFHPVAGNLVENFDLVKGRIKVVRR